MTDSNGIVTTMPVTPTYGSFGGGMGGFGGDSWAWILLLILFAGGGWGGGFGGYGNNIAADSAVLYPWMNQSNQISDGFRDQMLNTTVTGIQSAVTSGFGDVQTALCGGFAGVNAGIANGFAQAEIANNARQIADMQNAFASQTAMNQGFNSISSQMASCCCEERLGLANLGADIAREACADRQAVSDGVRNVMENCNRNNQAILDKLCQLELDNKNEKILELQNKLNMANLAASQTAQTAQLIADNTAQTQYIVNRVAPYPIPAYVVANPVTPAVFE